MSLSPIVEMLDRQITTLEQVRVILVGSTSEAGQDSNLSPVTETRKRVLSPEARARIVAAQKKRWAKAERKIDFAGTRF